MERIQRDVQAHAQGHRQHSPLAQSQQSHDE
jgi:hypothetical protein